MTEYSKLIKQSVVSFKKLIPTRCAICDGFSENTVCSTCHALFEANNESCKICAEPILPKADNTQLQTSLSLVCGQCLKAPPPYYKVISPYLYTTPVRELIIQFKFNGNLSLTNYFARQLTKAIQNKCTSEPFPDVVIPIPLHNKRLQQRGYNQAQLLARALSKQLEIPVDNGYLVRTKHLKPQAGLNRSQRIKNIKGTFALSNQTNIQYQHILLIDDVITTGATIREASKHLVAANHKVKITVCSIARAPSFS